MMVRDDRSQFNNEAASIFLLLASTFDYLKVRYGMLYDSTYNLTNEEEKQGNKKTTTRNERKTEEEGVIMMCHHHLL